MNPSHAHATESALVLTPAEYANTGAIAAAITPVDVTAYEGAIIVLQLTGVVTAGTLTGKLVTGNQSNLSDASDVVGGGFAAVGTTTDDAVAHLVVQANQLKKYLGYVGTIATGPAWVGVAIVATKKMV